jgi:uncharacterized small protein (DUF1192 family)
MNDLTSMMEQDFEESASSLDTINSEGLKSVAEIARVIAAKEAEIETLEATLKETKKQLLKLTDEDLPAMLQEMGLSKFSLDDGSEVSVKPTYGASIKVDNREAAFSWLREHGYDDIVKNSVFCSFGRGDDEMALQFTRLAEQQGLTPEQKTEVHPQTLKAWVKERVESGDEFPMELFGAFVGQRAYIKRTK